MSTTYIPAEIRRLVVVRAQGRCEYCLIHDDDTYFGCQIDHIISEKHGGISTSDNLAYACAFCDRNKGSDIGSLHAQTGDLVRFFNPRIDSWAEHFRFDADNITIIAVTSIGRVTARILGFNETARLLECHELHQIGRYPPVDLSI